MPNTLTIKLPNGQTETRVSDRPYSHAILVEVTQAQRDDVLGKIAQEMTRQAGIIAENEPKVDAADLVAYADAKKREAYLEEEIVETRDNLKGVRYEHKAPRWLSDEFLAASGSSRANALGWYDTKIGLKAINDAHAAVLATAQGRVEAARKQLEVEKRNYKHHDERLTLGKIEVYGWSQSAKGAAQQAAKATKYRTGAKITITTDITVHVPKKRAPKAK